MILNRLKVLCLVGFCTACGPQESGQRAETKDVIGNTNTSDISIGSGYNVLTGEVGDVCIDTSVGLTPETVSTSQTAWFSLKEVKTLEALQKSLNVSVAGAFNKGFSKGSAKVDYFNSLNMNQFTSYLMVTVKVENEVQKLKEYRLTPAAKELLRQDGRRFTQVCGDEFVSAIQTGGEFLAVVEFFSKTREEKEKIDAAVSASGGTWNVAADFKRSIESISKVGTVNVQIFRQGGQGSLPALSDLVETALAFPGEVTAAEKPWTLSWITRAYSTVLSATATEAPTSLRMQADYLADAAKVLLAARSRLNDVREVLFNPKAFAVDEAGIAELQTAEKTLAQIINSYSDQALACFADPVTQCRWPDAALPVVVLPDWLGLGNLNIQKCDAALRKALAAGDISEKQYYAYRKKNWGPAYEVPGDPDSTFAYAACDVVADNL